MSEDLQVMNEIYGMIKAMFPAWMAQAKKLNIKDQAIKYKYLYTQVEYTLSFGWDDLPHCKTQLETMLSEIKDQQHRLSQLM